MNNVASPTFTGQLKVGAMCASCQGGGTISPALDMDYGTRGSSTSPSAGGYGMGTLDDTSMCCTTGQCCTTS